MAGEKEPPTPPIYIVVVVVIVELFGGPDGEARFRKTGWIYSESCPCLMSLGIPKKLFPPEQEQLYR